MYLHYWDTIASWCLSRLCCTYLKMPGMPGDLQFFYQVIYNVKGWFEYEAVSFWVSAYFQGLWLLVSGRVYGCFQKIGVPQNGWWKFHEKPYEQMDDLGGNTLIFGNTHFWKFPKDFRNNETGAPWQSHWNWPCHLIVDSWSTQPIWYAILLMAEIRRSPVEVGSSSHYLQVFIHPRWWSPDFFH